MAEELDDLRAEVRRLTKELGKTESELAEARTKLDEANTEAGRRRHAYNEEKGRANQLAGELEKLTAKHAEQLEAQRIDLTGRATAAEAERDAARSRAAERTQQAALRIAAREAGLIDLDAIRLLDMSSLKTNEDGDVENAAEAFQKMRTAKPYLFGQANSSNPSPAPPRDNNQAPKQARDMTPEERQAGARALGITTRLN